MRFVRFHAASLALLAMLGGGGAFCGSAQAQEGWEYAVTPYLWGTGLSGKIGTLPRVPPVEVDLSFGDILENLEFAGMIVMNARNGRWGISGDLQYVKLAAEGETPGPLFGGTRIDSTSTIATVLGEYRLTETDGGALWLGAGARYWNVEMEAALKPGLLGGRSVSSDDSWVDPVIGLRGNLDLNERWFVTGWAYVGGFGAGSESMSDLFAGTGVRLTGTTSAVVGYRYLAVDRDEDGFLYDVAQQGLLAGLRFAF